MDPRALAERILHAVDARARAAVRSDRAEAERAGVRLPPDPRIVLVGHRAAGKSSVLPWAAQLAALPGFDLDKEIARRVGTPVRALVERDLAGFRRSEREVFQSLPPRSVIAAGGGFLAHHADLLEGRLPVLVPITFETYCERLKADASRPRLLPHLPLEEELAQVFAEREALHARSGAWGLGRFLAAVLAGGAG